MWRRRLARGGDDDGDHRVTATGQEGGSGASGDGH